MNKVMISPGRYVQGSGAIAQLGQHVKLLGSSAMVIGGKRGLASVQDAVTASFKKENLACHFEVFQGECSRSEIERLGSIAKKQKANVIIGIGGGKALDTAKAVGHHLSFPTAIVPTIAATDAPCSALSVIYTPDGTFESYLVLPKNPDLVLVDTAVIAKSPVRLLVSGMGDALATWFEADACSQALAGNLPGGRTTTAALQLARLCYDLLLQFGYQAKTAVECGVATEALEKVVEANTLLSGLGFESSGLAAAHAIHNGFTVLEETHHSYHGEKVAFGTLVQLVLENRSREELNEVISFCLNVGLPITLADIGVTSPNAEQLMQVAQTACAEGETIHNEPFPVTPEAVYAAILMADALGRKVKGLS